MIIRLDNKNKETAEQIVALQKVSYKVEADLIGFEKLPPLMETVDDIQGSDEIFFGYYIDDKLAGLISYKIFGDTLDIHRLAVSPDYFQRGIAKQLIASVVSTPGISKIIVCTGLENAPAVKLYGKLGFVETGKKEVAKDVFIMCFLKEL